MIVVADGGQTPATGPAYRLDDVGANGIERKQTGRRIERNGIGMTHQRKFNLARASALRRPATRARPAERRSRRRHRLVFARIRRQRGQGARRRGIRDRRLVRRERRGLGSGGPPRMNVNDVFPNPAYNIDVI